MKTVEEIRRARLKELVQHVGGLASLNRLTGKQDRDSTYSQLVNASVGSKTQKPKEMGSALARAIEEHLNLPRGWMDNEDSASTAWPFPSINRSSWDALSDAQRKAIEEWVRSQVSGFLSKVS